MEAEINILLNNIYKKKAKINMGFHDRQVNINIIYIYEKKIPNVKINQERN
jgi:hypothetical protein